MQTALHEGNWWKGGDASGLHHPHSCHKQDAGSKAFPSSKGCDVSCVALGFEGVRAHHESSRGRGLSLSYHLIYWMFVFLSPRKCKFHESRNFIFFLTSVCPTPRRVPGT